MITEKKQYFLKSTVIGVLLTVIVGCYVVIQFGAFFSSLILNNSNFTIDNIKHTTLELENTSSLDSVLTYVTLSDDIGFVDNVQGIFGILDSGLQGSFYLHDDSVYSYTSNKPISGNICFNSPPLNCPTDDFPTGTNLFEFTLNNYGTVYKAQETVDISNVAGANAIGGYKLTGGGYWISGGDSISIFEVYPIYQNVGRAGVYPFGCDDCTASVDPPKCSDTLIKSEAQKEHICNVSRDAKKSGGKVHITFTGFSK